MDETLYLELEKQILANYQDQNIMDELFEMQKIYHRSLFDCFNEIFFHLLHKNKRFLMWKKTPLKKAYISSILESIKNKLSEYSLLLCGIIRDKEDSMFDSTIRFFDNDAFCQIREEKMNQLIIQDLKEGYLNFYSSFN